MFIKFFSSYRLVVLPNFRSLLYSTELAEIVDGQICKPKRIKVILLDAFSKNPLSLTESPRREGSEHREKGQRRSMSISQMDLSLSSLLPLLLPVSYFLPSFFHPYLGGNDGSPPMSLSFFHIRGVNTFLERPVHNLFFQFIIKV